MADGSPKSEADKSSSTSSSGLEGVSAVNDALKKNASRRGVSVVSDFVRAPSSEELGSRCERWKQKA